MKITLNQTPLLNWNKKSHMEVRGNVCKRFIKDVSPHILLSVANLISHTACVLCCYSRRLRSKSFLLFLIAKIISVWPRFIRPFFLMCYRSVHNDNQGVVFQLYTWTFPVVMETHHWLKSEHKTWMPWHTGRGQSKMEKKKPCPRLLDYLVVVGARWVCT